MRHVPTIGPLFVANAARRPPQGHLYHYTSVVGFKEIVKTKVVWATAAQYLNDASELRHGVMLMSNELLRMVPKKDPRRSAAEFLARRIETLNRQPACAFSLSEQGNDLSQWRAYCPPEGGYALHFDADILREAVWRLKAVLAPCVYEFDEQRALAKECVESIVEDIPRVPTKPEVLERTLTPGLLSRVLTVAPFLKDDAFSSEREWRVVWLINPSNASILQFRTSGALLKPYVELPYFTEDGRTAFRGVTVGPMRFPEEAMGAASFLLSRHSTERLVSRSMIPFRTRE